MIFEYSYTVSSLFCGCLHLTFFLKVVSSQSSLFFQNDRRQFIYSLFFLSSIASIFNFCPFNNKAWSWYLFLFSICSLSYIYNLTSLLSLFINLFILSSCFHFISILFFIVLQLPCYCLPLWISDVQKFAGSVQLQTEGTWTRIDNSKFFLCLFTL